MSQLGSFIWGTADILRGPYKASQYGNVILPMTILRRLDRMLPKDQSIFYLHPDTVSNTNTGDIYDCLIRTFNESSDESPSEHFTTSSYLDLRRWDFR